MSAGIGPIRRRLRTLDPARAEFQNAFIAALNHREVAQLRLSARLAFERDRHGAAAWLLFDTEIGRVAAAPLLVDAALARMTAGPGQPDGIAAAAALGRVEPLIAAVETVVGAELHPAGLTAALDDPDLTVFRLDAADPSGALRHRLLVAIAPVADVRPLPSPGNPPVTGLGAVLRWTARLDGPPLTEARLRRLGTGDLIVLGTERLVVRLALPGRNDPVRASVGIVERTLRIEDQLDQGAQTNRAATVGRSAVPGEGGSSAPVDWSQVTLPITIEFEGGGITAETLPKLAPGSVLPLPSQGGTLAVRVLAGGARIADGELVAVGDGFGVLLTATAGTAEG